MISKEVIDKNDKSISLDFLLKEVLIQNNKIRWYYTFRITQKEINREINKECAEGIVKDNNDINEYFLI